MPAQVIGTGLLSGYIGQVARIAPGWPIEDYKSVDSTSNPIAFGASVWAMATGDSVADIATVTPAMTNFLGFAAAEVKENPIQVSTTTSGGVYKAYDIVDIIEAGIISLKFIYTTGTKQAGLVYIRTALNGAFPSEVVGDLRTAADGGNTLQLTNCRLQHGRFDANNITEVKLLYCAN